MPDNSRRICAACRFYVPAYVGPQTKGFCTWRETFNRPAHPHMNHGSTFHDSPDRKVREVGWDAGCSQFVEQE